MKREEYKKLNEEFLLNKEKEEGVTKITDGVLYKVIRKGKGGATPRRNSIVTVHYKGRLINGKEFDSSYRQRCAPAFRLNELITGWQIAMQQMHTGDKWEVTIAARHGYGTRTVGNIPAFSTLVFEIELIAIA
ncbi:MAG: FKBP-type peptidyl-prolyl cis-trans isomerase [Bacteroidaceae bacterium]|nr:FKBP-type peptidyl-prolyl cis-trans isomerase [Bacteroidaceae bacterium]